MLSEKNRALVERDDNREALLYLMGGGHGPMLNRLLDAAYAAGRAEVWEKVGPVLEPFANAAAHLHPSQPNDGVTLDGIEVRAWRRAAEVYDSIKEPSGRRANQNVRAALATQPQEGSDAYR